MAARITERSCLYCRHGRVQGAGRVECMNARSERRGMFTRVMHGLWVGAAAIAALAAYCRGEMGYFEMMLVFTIIFTGWNVAEAIRNVYSDD